MTNHGNWEQRKKIKCLLKPNSKATEAWAKNDREFNIAVMKKLRNMRTQEGNTMSLGIKLMNKKSTSPKRLKLWERKEQVLALKNSVKEMWGVLETTENRVVPMEEGIS